MNQRYYALLSLIILSLFMMSGCSIFSKPETEASSYSARREIGGHTEKVGEGEVVVKIFEERKNGLYTVSVLIIKNGKEEWFYKTFDNSSNFSISIPVSANIVAQAASQSTGSPDTNVTLFSQRLANANDAMLKAEYIKALEAINSALQIDNFNPQAHMMKGSIFYAMGKRQMARKEFDYVLKVDPTNEEVKRFKEHNSGLWENTADSGTQTQ